MKPPVGDALGELRYPNGPTVTSRHYIEYPLERTDGNGVRHVVVPLRLVRFYCEVERDSTVKGKS